MNTKLLLLGSIIVSSSLIFPEQKDVSAQLRLLTERVQILKQKATTSSLPANRKQLIIEDLQIQQTRLANLTQTTLQAYQEYTKQNKNNEKLSEQLKTTEAELRQVNHNLEAKKAEIDPDFQWAVANHTAKL